jgi:hypothetical protein
MLWSLLLLWILSACKDNTSEDDPPPPPAEDESHGGAAYIDIAHSGYIAQHQPNFYGWHCISGSPKQAVDDGLASIVIVVEGTQGFAHEYFVKYLYAQGSAMPDIAVGNNSIFHSGYAKIDIDPNHNGLDRAYIDVPMQGKYMISVYINEYTSISGSPQSPNSSYNNQHNCPQHSNYGAGDHNHCWRWYFNVIVPAGTVAMGIDNVNNQQHSELFPCYLAISTIGVGSCINQ